MLEGEIIKEPPRTKGRYGMQGPIKREPPPVKPDDCTCAYPKGLARNPTLHARTCPVYKRIMAEVERDSAPYEPLREAVEVDQFGPLAMGSDGEPFTPIESFHEMRRAIREDTIAAEIAEKAQPANEKEDDSPRGRIRAAGVIPGRPGQGAKS